MFARYQNAAQSFSNDEMHKAVLQLGGELEFSFVEMVLPKKCLPCCVHPKMVSTALKEGEMKRCLPVTTDQYLSDPMRRLNPSSASIFA